MIINIMPYLYYYKNYLLSKAISPYSRCVEGLVYIVIPTPSARQPLSYAEYTKANIRSFYDIRVISNTKYTLLIILWTLLVPYLISYKDEGII
jgi:hypothetical protein